MPRPLSNLEYVTFLDEVDPDNLNLPPWGGITQWGNEFVMMFRMAGTYDSFTGTTMPGEWALTDVSDGIPYGNQMIPIQTYVATVNRHIAPSGWTIYELGSDAMKAAMQAAADAGKVAAQVAGQYITVTSQMMAEALKNIGGGLVGGLGDALIPLALIALAVLFLYVNPRRTA